MPQGLYPPRNEATSVEPSAETEWQATQVTPGGFCRKFSGAEAPGLSLTTLPLLTSQ